MMDRDRFHGLIERLRMVDPDVIIAADEVDGDLLDIAGRDIEPSARQLSGSGQSLLRRRPSEPE